MDWLLKYWPILFCSFNFVGVLIIWSLHKTYAKTEAVTELDKRQTITEKQLSEMDTHSIELQLKEL